MVVARGGCQSESSEWVRVLSLSSAVCGLAGPQSSLVVPLL